MSGSCVSWKDLFAGASIGEILLGKSPRTDKDRQNEGFAFIMHAFARSPVSFVISAFFNPYLSSIARFAAAKSHPFNQVTWMGISMQASSYVSAYSTVMTVLVMILAPYMGALGDSTPYRRNFLVWTTNLGCICTILIGFCVRTSTWWLGGLLALLAIAFYEWSLTFVYAYLPEIGKSDEERNHISTHAVTATVGSQFVTMMVIAACLYALDPGSLTMQGTSVASQWSFANVTCGDSNLACTPASNGMLALNSSGLDAGSLGLYQYDHTDESKKSLHSRNLLLTGIYHVSPKDQDLAFRLWQDEQDNANTTCKRQSGANGYLEFFCSQSTTTSVSKLGYELQVPQNSSLKVGNFILYTEPYSSAPAAVSFTGFFWLFFSLISYVHFKPRLTVRREIVVSGNVRNKYFAFFKEVNANLWDTVKLVSKTPRTFLFYIGYTFYASGATAVITLAGTYFKEQLDLNSGLIGIIMLCSQIFGVPAAYFFHFVGKKIGFQVALFIVYILYTLSVILGYSTLIDRNTPVINVWIVCAAFGSCVGSAIGLTRASLSGMVPPGREAEYMGLFNFSGKLLSWIGPLVFTAVNEATGNLRNAFLSLLGPFILAAIFQFAVVLYPKQAVSDGIAMENRIFTVLTNENEADADADVQMSPISPEDIRDATSQ
jgi:MFS-type transporter involved in bile tolerance (Atg22 family)